MSEQRRSARAALTVYAPVAIVSATLGAFGASHAWAFERELFWTRSSGWCALSLLCGALGATPCARVVARIRGGRTAEPTVAAVRRALGIAAAAAATLHASVALGAYLHGAIAPVFALAWLRSAGLALVVLWALWATSFPVVLRTFRIALFKPLHRLAYAAVFLAFHHAFLAPLAPRAWTLALLALTVALFALRLVPRAPRKDARSV